MNFLLIHYLIITFNDKWRYVFQLPWLEQAYSLLRLPSTLYLVSTENTLIIGQFLPEFDFYGYKVCP